MFLGHTELFESASASLQAGTAWPSTHSVAGFSFISTDSCVAGLHFVKDLRLSPWGSELPLCSL